MNQQGNLLGLVLPIVIFILIFYFLIIRPQKKRQKEHQQLIDSLRRGDQVVTIGGIFGTVRDIKPDSFILEISDGVKIRVLKSAISFKREVAEKVQGETAVEEEKS